MYRTISNKKKLLSALLVTSIVLSGCSMKNVLEKNGGEIAPDDDKDLVDTLKDSVSSKGDDSEEVDPSLENYELSEEQKKLLEESESQSAEDAIDNVTANAIALNAIPLDEGVPQDKEHFKDPVEAAKYFSYYFFQLDSSQITAEVFYQKMKNHLGDAFLEYLPKDDKGRIDTFSSVQKSMEEFRKSPMTHYEISELEYTQLKFDATFQRKYVLQNGENIFYQTSIERDSDDNWKLVDNGSSAGFYSTKSNQ